jgi:hypothetical protein
MKTVLLVALVATALVLGHPQVTAAQGGKLRYLSAVYADDKGVGLRLPEGVACDDKGQFVVGDTGNDRLLRFGFQDRTLAGGAEIRIAQLQSPTRVRLNSKGEIYALDGKARRIVHLSAAGEFKGVLSFDGAPPPSTIVPKSFEIGPADTIYVLDVFSSRVLVLGSDGRFHKALPLPDAAGFITDLAVDALGGVLVLDSIGRRIYAAPSDATAFSPLGGDLKDILVTLPTALAASRGLIFVVEGSGGSIASFGQDGTFLARQLSSGWQEGALNHPSQLCINGHDEVFVADRDNSRVQVFALGR